MINKRFERIRLPYGVINKRFEEKLFEAIQRAFFYEVEMIENGFYKVKQEFIDLIREIGGTYKDAKERPVFCCFEDKHVEGLFWAIPTSDISHRSPEQIKKINEFLKLSDRDIRSSWYHIGHTNKPALYRISSCFPITDKYIDSIYTSHGKHLVLAKKSDIEIIRKKLSRIIFDETKHPNKYEQHITDIKTYLLSELIKKNINI